MRRIGPNSFTEIYLAGCNPGFVETSDGYVMIDSPQQPIDAVRWRELLEEKAPIRYLVNTEPHGDHTFSIIHMPGHTAPQTSVQVPEEGIVFTGDNVFHKCRSSLQECDPWEWLAALQRIAALDVETIVPSHGEPSGKAYLMEQAQIVENWVGFVETQADRGVGPEEILKEGVPVTAQNPYPIGQRLFIHDERLTGLIVRNLHTRILERKAAARAG